MILADKIIEERKRIGLSQEELAEKLEVSRQSVSKWESAQSVPDINRIILMAEIFDVSTDYLLKDDAVRDMKKEALNESVESVRSAKKVSMEEATEFLSLRRKQSPIMALAVSMCIVSPIPLIVLAGFADGNRYGITENLAAGIGVITLLVLIAIAVVLFIKCGTESAKFGYLEKDELDTVYGVDGMAREKRNAFESTYNRFVTLGVILCILCPVPLLIATFLNAADVIIVGMVGVLLLMVAFAVNMFIRVGMIKESYDCLLQEGDYTSSKKANKPVMGRVGKIYWMTAVAIYLAISFVTEDWSRSWIVWPVAGVLFPVVISITKMIIKAEED